MFLCTNTSIINCHYTWCGPKLFVTSRMAYINFGFLWAELFPNKIGAQLILLPSASGVLKLSFIQALTAIIVAARRTKCKEWPARYATNATRRDVQIYLWPQVHTPFYRFRPVKFQSCEAGRTRAEKSWSLGKLRNFLWSLTLEKLWVCVFPIKP